ncbi:MAG: aldose 1-epimerase family protein [Bacteroidota bacterium]
MHYIENKYLRVGIQEKGAELSSIVHLATGQEYMWEADPEFWGHHSSILFPIIGKVKNDQIHLEGKSYSIKQHGFARNETFDILDINKDRICFQLLYTTEGQEDYPYRYELQATYELEESAVHITYKVLHHGPQEMYFSIGAHPAFKCPLKAGEKRSDYQLVFEKEEVAHRHFIEGGLRTGETQLVLNQEKVLPIDDHLFDKDALIFKDLASNTVSLIHKSGRKVLDFGFGGFPYLGIWSRNEFAPFVCIEPWFGVADPLDGSNDFKSKEGVLSLAAEAEFECRHSLRIY